MFQIGHYTFARNIFNRFVVLIEKNSFEIIVQCQMGCAGLPRSGKNIWKMKVFPGQGKVGEFCGWPGKFRKELESQGKVRDFENKWLWLAVFRKFILL